MFVAKSSLSVRSKARPGTCSTICPCDVSFLFILSFPVSVPFNILKAMSASEVLVLLASFSTLWVFDLIFVC